MYLGNIPSDLTAEHLLDHVHSGVIEFVKIFTEKNCAFISFLNHASASHFYSDAALRQLSINSHDIKVGWGKSSSLPAAVALAVSQDGATRNVYIGNLPDDITEEEIREDMSQFGAIDTIKLIKDKNIGFVHFLSISAAMKAVQKLAYEDTSDTKWATRKVFYGKDRCAFVSRTQQQNAAQYLGIAPGYEHILATADRDLISSALAQQSAAAVAVAAAAGGTANVGNRTLYLGAVHPETTIEEICNVVRGGLLHNIRYIPEKHICFITFVDPTAAAQFYALATLQGLAIHNRRLKIGWGKHSGPLPQALMMAVTAGASRNVYIGNIDESWPESKLRYDFSEYGEIEQINFLPEKSCAFVNFTNIANAIKAIDGIKEKEEYKQFKINFGKDRCANPSRHLLQQPALAHGHVASSQSTVTTPTSSTSVTFGALGGHPASALMFNPAALSPSSASIPSTPTDGTRPSSESSVVLGDVSSSVLSTPALASSVTASTAGTGGSNTSGSNSPAKGSPVYHLPTSLNLLHSNGSTASSLLGGYPNFFYSARAGGPVPAAVSASMHSPNIATTGSSIKSPGGGYTNYHHSFRGAATSYYVPSPTSETKNSEEAGAGADDEGEGSGGHHYHSSKRLENSYRRGGNARGTGGASGKRVNGVGAATAVVSSPLSKKPQSLGVGSTPSSSSSLASDATTAVDSDNGGATTVVVVDGGENITPKTPASPWKRGHRAVASKDYKVINQEDAAAAAAEAAKAFGL